MRANPLTTAWRSFATLFERRVEVDGRTVIDDTLLSVAYAWIEERID
jgi:hypothetical protein